MMRTVVLALSWLVFISCNKQTTQLVHTEQPEELELISYKAGVDSLREVRVKALKEPQGWLSLIGLHWLKEGVNTIGAADDNHIIFPRIETETIGAYQLDASGVFFGKVEGVEVMSDGHEYMGGPVDVSYPPTVVNHESLFWYILNRGDKYGLRLKDTLSDQRLSFSGIPYFLTDKSYRVTATVRVPAEQETIAITNVLGNTSDVPVGAYLDFELKGKKHTLTALDEGGDTYFVVFGDMTNGVTSYGGGRFLYPNKAENEESTTLDFNLSENPPCAFTDFATCPLPPTGNVLQISVSAGEKKIAKKN